MGDFEFALVFYHRGCRLRPDLGKFRLGIEKSQEAIVNCVGSKTCHLPAPAVTAQWPLAGETRKHQKELSPVPLFVLFWLNADSCTVSNRFS